MQGTADQHVDPAVNAAFARRLGGDVTFKQWDGLGHELHAEVQRNDVLAYARAWIDAHVK